MSKNRYSDEWVSICENQDGGLEVVTQCSASINQSEQLQKPAVQLQKSMDSNMTSQVDLTIGGNNTMEGILNQMDVPSDCKEYPYINYEQREKS